jgi:energy-coupling factor transporter ATP-binding protein EcfA2
MRANGSGAAMDDNDLARAGKLPVDPAEGTAEVADETEDGGKARRLAAENDEKPKTSRLAELLKERAPMVLSPTGRPYALIGDTARACTSEEFVGWCAWVFYSEYNETISKSGIGDVVRALSGSGLQTRPIHVRVGGDRSRITLDLGSSAVAVTAEGITPAPDAVFARPPGSLPLPAPVPPGSATDAADAVEAMRGVLGVEGRTWTACVAWLLAALRPEGPYPILYIRGEHGSGKSTLAKALLSLIDPRRPDMRALPREPRDLAILAEHVHVIGIDNLSAITGEMSDALCRLATGDGFATRALYSDRDLAVFDSSRPMMMTSIVDAATRPDLLDRALIVDLPARAERSDDDEIRAAVERLRPHVLGALLYAASHALRASDARISGDVRMRAPASFAARAAPALGFTAAAIEAAYLDSRAAAHGVVAEDPVVEAVLRFLHPGRSWAGTMTTLLDALNDRRHGRPPHGWPESARGLGAALRRLAPTLRALGVTHVPPDDRQGHDNVRQHRLTRDAA